MAVWSNRGIPHKGWTCIDVIDLAENAYGMDYATRRDEVYETCEMCNQEGIRYVHVMTHPEYQGYLRVGCSCAEKMENDYSTPRNRENHVKNRSNRKANFFRQQWQQRPNGNLVLRYKGDNITIMRSKFNQNEFGVAYGGEYIWNYNGQKIRNVETAKAVAFYAFDC